MRRGPRGSCSPDAGHGTPFRFTAAQPLTEARNRGRSALYSPEQEVHVLGAGRDAGHFF